MKKVYYGWWIVLATNIICMLGFGTWLYSFGVFFKPMMTEFGWSRAVTSGAASLRSVEGGIAAPVVGWAVDRFGIRWIIIIGALISGLGFALMPLVDSIWGFYILYGIVVSIGMSAMLYLPAFTVLSRWFKRKLSFAFSLLAIGAGLGGLICAPAAAMLIKQYGWRITFLIIGITIWVVVIPLALVVKNRPEDMGLRPDGDPPIPETDDESGESLSTHELSPDLSLDFTLRQALASSTFWLLSMSFFFQAMAHSVVFVHSIPALTDVGITPKTAALSVGFLTLVSVAGRLSFGMLGDKIDKRYLFAVAYICMGIGTLLLMKATTMLTVWLFIVFFGVGFGGTVPLMPGIRAEYFGSTALGKIQGFMSPIAMLAGAIGPVTAGYLFDVNGNYDIAFTTTGLLTFMAAGSVMFIKPVDVVQAKMLKDKAKKKSQGD